VEEERSPDEQHLGGEQNGRRDQADRPHEQLEALGARQDEGVLEEDVRE
jgi:hypothetical protein